MQRGHEKHTAGCPERGGRFGASHAKSHAMENVSLQACGRLHGTTCNWHYSARSAGCMLRPAPSW
eukprot:8088480-Lingulodinium_polyedra.AAC.1